MSPQIPLSGFNRTEWKFLVLFLLSESWIFASFWVIFLTNKGWSLIDVALVDLTFYITVFVFEIPTGAIADKFGRKFSVILSNILWFLGILIFFILDQLIWSIFSFAILGIAMTLTSGAREAWIYDEIKFQQEELGKEIGNRYQYVFGTLVSVSLISKAVGGVLGGIHQNGSST